MVGVDLDPTLSGADGLFVIAAFGHPDGPDEFRTVVDADDHIRVVKDRLDGVAAEFGFDCADGFFHGRDEWT